MDKHLPIYNLEIVSDLDSDVEVDYVALVDKPAIKKNFLAFKDQKIQQAFAIQDEEQHIITGALMLADTPIYRNDDNGEYFVVFSKDTIKQIAQKFFTKGYQNNVNLMHDSGQKLDGLTMYESWITDSKRGIYPMKGFENVPDGSWFGSFKVNNPDVWQMIKQGLVKGFSVEGLFSYKKSDIQARQAEQLWSQIQDILTTVDFEWNDEDHPRDENGRFSPGEGAGKTNDQNSGKVNYKNAETLKQNVDKILSQPPNHGTLEIFTDPKTGSFTESRQEFHQEVIKDYVKDGSTNNGTSYFMGGAPATGKSSIINSGDVVLPKGILVVDSDQIKSKLPEYNEMVKRGEGEAAARVHEESSTLSKAIINGAAKSKWDIVNDGVGDGKYEDVKAKVEQQREAGKKVVANYVTTDTQVSVDRAYSRAERTGRKVPEQYIRNMHREVSKIVPRAAKDGLFDELRLYDNNGSKPKLIMEQVGKKITVHDKALYDRFLAKAHE